MSPRSSEDRATAFKILERSVWKVEKIISKGEYNYSLVKEHPKATKAGYVLHHRIVVENHLNRILNPNEVVHHKDGNKKNNHIDNLEVMDSKSHNRLHSSKGRSMVDLKCPNCGVAFTREKRKTHIVKHGKYTMCSRKCNGEFSRNIQLFGLTAEMDRAISGNIVRQYIAATIPSKPQIMGCVETIRLTPEMVMR